MKPFNYLKSVNQNHIQSGRNKSVLILLSGFLSLVLHLIAHQTIAKIENRIIQYYIQKNKVSLFQIIEENYKYTAYLPPDKKGSLYNIERIYAGGYLYNQQALFGDQPSCLPDLGISCLLQPIDHPLLKKILLQMEEEGLLKVGD